MTTKENIEKIISVAETLVDMSTAVNYEGMINGIFGDTIKSSDTECNIMEAGYIFDDKQVIKGIHAHSPEKVVARFSVMAIFDEELEPEVLEAMRKLTKENNEWTMIDDEDLESITAEKNIQDFENEEDFEMALRLYFTEKEHEVEEYLSE